MRNACSISALLLCGGAATILTVQRPVVAQTPQIAPVLTARTGSRPQSFADLVEKLQPAVVNISASQRVTARPQNPFAGTPFADMFGGGGDGAPTTRDAVSLGSGFLISPDGYIVTNNHVLTGGDTDDAKGVVLQSVTVTLADHTEYTAKIVGRDATADIAVLKVAAKAPFPFVRFGDSTQARVGDWVLAVGNPFALSGTVTAGIVSAIHRVVGDIGTYHRFIQTDAAINSGNSGGPLFDMNGDVIGINNLIQGAGGGGNIGIGFAIPSEEAKPVVDILMRGGAVRRGYLGVAIQQVDDQIASALGLPMDRGEIVARVEPGYAAARAGIEQGDVIVSVRGQPVTPDNPLTYLVASLPIGSSVPIELYRRGVRMSVTAVIGERPPESQFAALGGDTEDGTAPGGGTEQKAASNALGATLQTLTPPLARQVGVPEAVRGVVIASVDGDNDLASHGLKRGDVILGIDQQPTATVAAAAAALAAARRANRDTVLLLVQRGAQPPLYTGVKLKKG